MTTDEQRAVEYRLFKDIEVSLDGCLLWKGKLFHGKPYGRFWLNGKNRKVHRVVYERVHGPIPDGLTIDHLCRVENCVNPRHMEAVDIRTNVLRGNGPTATNARKTHCKRGHDLTGANLYNPPGRPQERRCHICRRAYTKAYASRRVR